MDKTATKPASAAHPDALVARLETLADPVRLRVLRMLERHELGVDELRDVLQMPQSSVSRHLKLLLEAGWVRRRKQGTSQLYRMILDELDPVARKLWLTTREQTDAWAAVQQDALRLARRLSDRDGDSQAFFAGAAGQWERLRDQLYGQSFLRAAALALLPGDYVVADLGCGTASVSAELAPHVRQVIGVDNSTAMLKAAERRTKDLPNVELRRGELTDLPLDVATADAALLLLVLTYIPDVAAALTEAARVTKPGGKLVIVDLLPHDRDDFRRQMGQTAMGFEPDELKRQLTAAGWGEATVVPVSPAEDAKGPALFLATAIREEARPCAAA
ncbi:MAG TPA: metalloregulator ArsR/SmtB family transcription factor [Tepidisphaeraceae bacterium]|nr:metalloregulator ArsR/SmtB family transcription factor [Tepidisphaeraceae bacterium]